MKWCAQNGFEVTEVAKEMDEEYEGFPVEFTHVGPVMMEEIYEKTSLAAEGAEEFDGGVRRVADDDREQGRVRGRPHADLRFSSAGSAGVGRGAPLALKS